jgi:starch phosphorylase
LTAILDETIGNEWRKQPEKLEKLLDFKDNLSVQSKIANMKLIRKQILAKRIFQEQGLIIDPNSIFDIQVKRLHEYKRQLMNALNIMHIYHCLKTDPDFKNHYVPHTFIFGAKAAGAYYFAKKVIKLLNSIGEKINSDPETNAYLKVVFVENYNVSYAEIIMPACDISEQISTASKEASGTGNMKFMMNGALTIGTEDGANVEIHELVGDQNIFIFGLNAEEVTQLQHSHQYHPREIYESTPALKIVIDQLINGFFDSVDKNEFKEIYDRLLNDDTYFILKDFIPYVKAHLEANEAYKDSAKWFSSSIVNIAKSGVFSSDRSIKDYCEKIWHTEPIL